VIFFLAGMSTLRLALVRVGAGGGLSPDPLSRLSPSGTSLARIGAERPEALSKVEANMPGLIEDYAIIGNLRECCNVTQLGREPVAGLRRT
jgi:hypothetical protein